MDCEILTMIYFLQAIVASYERSSYASSQNLSLDPILVTWISIGVFLCELS